MINNNIMINNLSLFILLEVQQLYMKAFLSWRTQLWILSDIFFKPGNMKFGNYLEMFTSNGVLIKWWAADLIIDRFEEKLMVIYPTLVCTPAPIHSEMFQSIRTAVDLSFRPNDKPLQLQVGALRTNCVDCLDRTNVAQYFVGNLILLIWSFPVPLFYYFYFLGRGVLSHQLKSLGLLRHLPLSLESAISRVLSDLYDALGDQLSLQYGGNNLYKWF